MALRTVTTLGFATLLLGAVAPAAAMSLQSSPGGNGLSARIADPDAAVEHIADQSRRSDQHLYNERVMSNRNLVQPSGPAVAPPLGFGIPR